MAAIPSTTSAVDLDQAFSSASALAALALLEHWFMVLPLPDEKLWRWMLPDRSSAPQATRLSEDA